MSTAWANPTEKCCYFRNAARQVSFEKVAIQFLSFRPLNFDPVRRYYPLALFSTKADKVNGRAAADGLLANPVRSERKQP